MGLFGGVESLTSEVEGPTTQGVGAEAQAPALLLVLLLPEGRTRRTRLSPINVRGLYVEGSRSSRRCMGRRSQELTCVRTYVEDAWREERHAVKPLQLLDKLQRALAVRQPWPHWRHKLLLRCLLLLVRLTAGARS
jgi:hypothetical protein